MTKDEARFWIKVNKTDTCWLWTASLHSKGYGFFGIGSKVLLAHRVAYEFALGKIPDGLQIDHLCRVRNCVNPAHLEVVTNRENSLRGNAPSIITHRTGICRKGLHRIEGHNVFMTSKGFRLCKTCYKARKARMEQKRTGNPARNARRREAQKRRREERRIRALQPAPDAEAGPGEGEKM